MESAVIAAIQSKVVCLPGGKDKDDRPIIVIIIPQENNNNFYIATTLQYLVSIFSDESRSRGFTIIVDARKGSWRLVRSCLRQISSSLNLDEVIQILIIRPDGFWEKQKVENCTKSHIEQITFVLRPRLNKYVDQSQLPTDLGGDFIFNNQQWFDNRMKIDEFYIESENCLADLEEIQEKINSIYAISANLLQNNHHIILEKLDILKISSNNCIEKGRELIQKIEYDNRNRKFASESDSMTTPQDTLDAIDKLESIIGCLRTKLIELENAKKSMKKSYINTKDLLTLQEGVVRVINWILGPAENLLKAQCKVGYDVASAEELRKEHERIELQCWNAYGAYAELIYKIDMFANETFLTAQQKDLISQKDFMDFVCRSFASRLERRRNILITSLRFFRLVSEYFDKTGDVFDSLVMGYKIDNFECAGQKLRELQDNQTALDNLERELVKEGEKLSDILSIPVKDALGRELDVDYSEDIVNIKDILDATVARKNIFGDSVELQKLTLEQVSHIHQYETETLQAITWLDELFYVLINDHSHVGCTIYEIQSQKLEHQAFQETAKCAYNFGIQLLNASAELRNSCRLDLKDNENIHAKLKYSWDRLLSVSQEQMTRLRVSTVFHRSVEEQCNQLRDLREAIATMPLMSVNKKRAKVSEFLIAREKLLVEVGRMVRLGRLLRSRLKEPLFIDDAMSESTTTISDSQNSMDVCGDNGTAVEVITEKLTEITELAEDLDQTLKSAHQDCSTSPLPTILTVPMSNSKFSDASTGPSEDLQLKVVRAEDVKSDDEFLTASECTLQHSRSSSYNTASDSENLYSSWWEAGKDEVSEDLAKEKMVLAVGLPELPAPETLPHSQITKVPPGKIVKEVTETTHIKVEHSHTFGVKSFVLTSETIRDKSTETNNNNLEQCICMENKEVAPTQQYATKQQLSDEHDDFLQKIKEVGDDVCWKSYKHVTKQTLKSCI